MLLVKKKQQKRPFPRTEEQTNKHHLFLEGLNWGSCYQRYTTDTSHGCTDCFPFSCESERSCQRPPALFYHEGHSGARRSEPQREHSNSYSDFRAHTDCRIAQLVIVNRVITGKSEQKGEGGGKNLPCGLLRISERWELETTPQGKHLQGTVRSGVFDTVSPVHHWTFSVKN